MATDPLCPSCKSPVLHVKPVRISSDPDSRRWEGRQPLAMGFTCPMCSVLLPLSPTAERDDPGPPGSQAARTGAGPRRR